MGAIISSIINNVSKNLISIFPSLNPSQDDNYLDDFVIHLLNNSLIVFNTITAKNALGDNYSKQSLVDYYKKSYINSLLSNGFSYSNIENMFSYYPSEVSYNVELIGEYVINMPFCKFLEKTDNPHVLVIKLDGNSKYDELNMLSSILREKLRFNNLILNFSYDPIKKMNFLSLSSILYDDSLYYPESKSWKHLIGSAFTELFLIAEIFHGSWHLIVAHIVYIAQESLKNTNILDIFNLSEENVFLKALEVKIIVFGTNHIFGQVLNDNPKFIKFLKNYISNFLNNFNINTVFSDYFIHDLNHNQHWMIGMEQNIKDISEFVDSIFNGLKNESSNKQKNSVAVNLTNENNQFTHHISSKYIINVDLCKCPNLLKKYLQILLVVGGSFHSTTLEFGKLVYTDLIINHYFDLEFYQILTQVITIDKSDLFLGDVRLYKGSFYNEEIMAFSANLFESRNKISTIIKTNKIFPSSSFASIEDAYNHIDINTHTTFV